MKSVAAVSELPDLVARRDSPEADRAPRRRRVAGEASEDDDGKAGFGGEGGLGREGGCGWGGRRRRRRRRAEAEEYEDEGDGEGGAVEEEEEMEYGFREDEGVGREGAAHGAGGERALWAWRNWRWPKGL